MSLPERRRAAVVTALRGLECDFVAYVPSNSIAAIITALEETGGPTVFPVSREEEAVGVVGALPLAGQFGAIVMQDNGFGNALTALTTFAVAYHLPLLIVANTRGGLGEYNSMIHSISENVPALLRTSGIPVFSLDRRTGPEDWRGTVAEAGKHAPAGGRADGVLRHRGGGGRVKRIDALGVITELGADLPVVATCAATSRELAAVADRPNHLYLLDSMGLTTSVGTGLALACAGTAVSHVITVDGDGSLLMNLGALATAGYLAPAPLLVVLLDNGVYASTGNIPTQAGRIDLGAVAAACGLNVATASTADALRGELGRMLGVPGPHLLHVRVEPGNESGTPLLLDDPVVLGHRFRTWLTARMAGSGR